jgi:hypothetical protein
MQSLRNRIWIKHTYPTNKKINETKAKYVQHHTVQTRFPIKDQILFIIAAGILFVLQLMLGMVENILVNMFFLSN